MRLPVLAGAAAAAMLVAGCSGSGPSAKGALAADYDKAADALLAKMNDPAAKGQLPGKDDPAVKDYDDAASRAMSALGTDDLPATGFDSFDRICGKGAKIIQAYINGGTGGAADVQTMNANAQRYMDQMFTPLLFSAHCTAAHLPFIDRTVGDADIKSKAAAVAQIRGGAWGQASGLLEMAGDPSFDAARRQRIMDLLAGDAGNFAIVFSAAQRQELARTAQSIKPLLPKDSQPDADRVSDAVLKAPCGKLCKAG